MLSVRRGIHVARRLLKAQLLDMPAMSPTMTEGGIVNWAFQPGQSFAAGDVLLDIETDKAQISVEAQDDGILAKILKENGAKEVPVGTPIAVLCDPEDDVSSIDYNALLEKAAKSEKKETKPEPEQSPETPSAPVKEVKLDAIWLPSVARLAHTFGVDPKNVKGTGPNGRVLKGDLLAAAGKIPKEAPHKLSQEIEARQHLDLSYKPVAAQAAAPEPTKKVLPVKIEAQVPLDTIFELGVPLDFAVTKASRLAIRDSIIAAKPKPSVLRSRTLDLLCEPKNKIPYLHDIKIVKLRGEPVSIHVEAEYPQNAGSNVELRASVFVEQAQYYLTQGAKSL